MPVKHYDEWITDCIAYLREPRLRAGIEAMSDTVDLWVDHVNKAANAAPPPCANLGTRFTVAYGISQAALSLKPGRESGASGRMSRWLRSATTVIASRPRLSSTRSG